MRTIGTVLLAAGFVALTASDLITDPTAPDANIGAGMLILAGRLAGATGLGLLLLAAILRATRGEGAPS